MRIVQRLLGVWFWMTLCLAFPLTGGAQTVMEFEPEDLADDFGDESHDPFLDEDPFLLPRLVALVIRSGDAEDELAFRLTQSLVSELRRHNLAEVLDPEDFRARLLAPGEQAALDCSANAVCLAGYGKELWIDKLIMGVLYKERGGYRLQVDMIGVDNAEIEAYHTVTIDGSMSRSKTEDAAVRVIRRIFNLRDQSPLEEGPRKRMVAMRGPMQTSLAWVATGISVVAAGTGAAFGLSTRSIDTDLRNDQSVSQVQAAKMIDDGKSHSTIANIMYAASAASLVASVSLFLIKPLHEVEDDRRPMTPGIFQPQVSRGSSWTITPFAAHEGMGMQAGFRF